MILIQKLESPQSIKLQSTIGGTMNLCSSAMGKAILATYSPQQFHGYLDTHELKALISNTITSSSQLRKNINLIKQTGFAINSQENESDVFCIGAAVKKDTRLYYMVRLV